MKKTLTLKISIAENEIESAQRKLDEIEEYKKQGKNDPEWAKEEKQLTKKIGRHEFEIESLNEQIEEFAGKNRQAILDKQDQMIALTKIMPQKIKDAEETISCMIGNYGSLREVINIKKEDIKEA